jgi:hypothetical protein
MGTRRSRELDIVSVKQKQFVSNFVNAKHKDQGYLSQAKKPCTSMCLKALV